MDMAFDATPETDDATLLRLYAEGDARAARLLTERLAPLAYRLALRLLADSAEAEDIAQEAMLRLWRAAPGWRAGEAKPSTWLYTVTRNLCTDRLRAAGRGRGPGLEEIAEPADPAPGAEARLTQAARADALQDALMKLPERQREAVILRHIEGLANPQIAQIMDISTEAVESLTARGKRALAAILSGRRAELGYDNG